MFYCMLCICSSRFCLIHVLFSLCNAFALLKDFRDLQCARVTTTQRSQPSNHYFPLQSSLFPQTTTLTPNNTPSHNSCTNMFNQITCPDLT
ncbi:hypothetical protein BZA70DRAFT_55331 [Myxozyma melibiosi]|uniref:Secreted protein n=1 Tax=Myxozyma melibiosi TaxID=54550 RepID=A0ABR1FFN7_9ASCO